MGPIGLGPSDIFLKPPWHDIVFLYAYTCFIPSERDILDLQWYIIMYQPAIFISDKFFFNLQFFTGYKGKNRCYLRYLVNNDKGIKENKNP